MEVTRLFDALYYQRANYPQDAAIKAWNGSQWESFSTDQCIELTESLAIGLINKGVKAGEKVAIISQLGSPAWNIVDFALQMIGAIPVPLHASAHPKQISYIAKDADFHFCFSANENLAKIVKEACADVNQSVTIFLLANATEDFPNWKKLIRPSSDAAIDLLKQRKSAVQPKDLATIIYTSGTTGDPKGVMLSHYNILCNINSTMVLLPVHAGQRTLSYLPLSHIFERMVIFTYWVVGASVHYARSVDTIMEDLKFVQPHYFTSVPRLLERVYEKLISNSNEGSGLKRRLLKWSIKLGERYQQKERFAPGFWLKRKIADLLVYRHWRNIIGGKVKGVIVGAAALQPRLGRMFSAAGIKIREGYGLTETSPVVSFNRFEPGGNRFGTVGIPIPGVEIKINQPNEDGEGEVFVKGPNVMLGYYQKPEITTQVIDKDQWFHTGDTGKLVHKHFLQITGRKKDIFKTTTGKYVAPFHVENTLKANIYISQCMVLGSGMPHPGALIIPNFNHLEQWCSANNVHWTAPQFMVINPKIKQLFAEIIRKQNQQLSKEEKVRQFYLLHEEWSIPTGEYGPTLKLIRAFIRKKYEKEIRLLFEAKDNLVPK